LFAVPVVAAIAFAAATGAFASGGDGDGPSAGTAGAPTEAALSLGFIRHLAAQGNSGAANLPKLPASVGGENPLVGQATDLDGQPVWMSASGDRICLYFIPRAAIAPGGGCDDARIVADKGVTTSMVYSDQDIAFAGAVPDGVESVTLKLHDGSEAVARVDNNAYAIALKGLPRSVVFAKADGEVVEQPQFARATLDPGN